MNFEWGGGIHGERGARAYWGMGVLPQCGPGAKPWLVGLGKAP